MSMKTFWTMAATTGVLALGVSQSMAITTAYSLQNGGVIPYNSSSSFEIQVSGAESLLDLVEVRIALAHTNLQQLEIALVSPTNVLSVILFNNRGSTGDHLKDTYFEDDALTPIASGTAPFSGSFIPDQPLNTFLNVAGMSVNGTWKIQIDNGSLFSSGNGYLFGLNNTQSPPWTGGLIGTQLILTTHNDNPVPPTAGVPEPMTAGLTFMAIAGLGLALRRR